MIHKEKCKLYELKGRLGARCISIEHDIVSLTNLAGKVETRFYEGYVQGTIFTLSRFRDTIHGYLDEICQIIEEVENAKE